MPDNFSARLEPIAEEDFRNYLNLQVQEYAKEKIKSGNWTENDALDLSRKYFFNLLPNGKDTLSHSIMTIVDSGSNEKVRVFWVKWRNKEYKAPFISDIVIYENFRRKGYGSGIWAQ